MATATGKGFPYPEDTDPADVPADLQALADAVDDSPGIASLTGAEIAALTVGEKWAGRVVWNETTLKLQVSDGASFADVDSSDVIAKTLVDAKGDLIVGTAADTVARLAVGGTNGHVLMVDSAQSAGVKWAAVDGLPSQTSNAGKYLTTNGTTASWADVGAKGGGSDKVFYENDATVTTDYTITASKNAISAGPITIDTGATVTVPSGSVWTVV